MYIGSREDEHTEFGEEMKEHLEDLLYVWLYILLAAKGLLTSLPPPPPGLRSGHCHVGSRPLLPEDLPSVPGRVCQWGTHSRRHRHGREGLSSRGKTVRLSMFIVILHLLFRP